MSEEAIKVMRKAHVDALSYKKLLTREMHKDVRDAVSQMHEMIRDCAPEAAIKRLLEMAEHLSKWEAAREQAAKHERYLRELSTKVIDEIERAKADPWPS
tara:strand:+ start:239 stop:538 length:300 start_codon:yes stop_codon:yes gene_type:complete